MAYEMHLIDDGILRITMDENLVDELDAFKRDFLVHLEAATEEKPLRTLTSSSDPEGKTDLVSEVIVPITSVCPCSREISDVGAHNQRGEVRLAVRFRKFIWLEDMIEMVEACASCDVYSVLKRVDEKQVTERGYNNPKFVEDIVRDVAVALKADPNITWFSVSAENFESIHNHSAYAHITSDPTSLSG